MRLVLKQSWTFGMHSKNLLRLLTVLINLTPGLEPATFTRNICLVKILSRT